DYSGQRDGGSDEKLPAVDECRRHAQKQTLYIVCVLSIDYICRLKFSIMIMITLPDGSVREFQNGATPMDVAMSISEGLARNVISASFNDTTVETTTPLTTDGKLTLRSEERR